MNRVVPTSDVAKEVKVKGLSFSVYVALLVLTAGGLSAQVPGGWVPRPDVPHNVYGRDCADLVFVRRPESTFVFAYNAYGFDSWFNAYRPQLGNWSGDLAAPPFSLWRFAMTYSPDAGRIYAVGRFEMGERLYTYAFDSPSGSSGTWSSEALPFHLNLGSKMAYRPNRDYRPLWAIPGWLYVTGMEWYLPEPTEFKLYRYSIPAPEDMPVDGYCPGDSAVIADATPNFIWPPVAGAVEYRIQVSTMPLFPVTEIDELTHDTTFQVPESLSLTTGLRYWRTMFRDSLGGWTTGQVLQFTLQGGWDDGVACPWTEQPQYGASLVYTSRVGGPSMPMAESLWATDGYSTNTNFWRYSIHSGNWSQALALPMDPYNSMMASAPNPTTDQSEQIYAVFDNYPSTGAHYRFDLTQSPAQWVHIYEAPFPREPGSCCRLAYDPALESLYATVGGDTDLFYARWAGSGGGDLGGRTSGIQAELGGREDRRLLVGKSGDGFFVQYALPMSEPTRLDVFDPTGRKVLSRDMGVQVAGEHTLRVSASEAGARGHARRGVLLIRLTHGSTIEHAKVVLF